MLRTARDLQGFRIKATDGEIGSLNDLYFDDVDWVVRYFVVDTGNWLPGRRVLISPISMEPPDWRNERLPVSLTQQQVRESPPIDTEKPVSRQHEEQYLSYYGYPYYWRGTGLWGMGAYPGFLTPTPPAPVPEEERLREDAEAADPDDAHLRSAREVRGYHIAATDGEIGHVADFLVDDETWAIRYVIVDTSNWWGGRSVLVSPQWIRRVDWHASKAVVDLTREAVKSAPAYEPDTLDRSREASLFEHYGRPGYWTREEGRIPETPRSGR